MVNRSSNPTNAELEKAVEGKVIGWSLWVKTYERKSKAFKSISFYSGPLSFLGGSVARRCHRSVTIGQNV